MLTNLILISQGSPIKKDEEFDGFPLAVGLMNIMFRCFDLLEVKKKNPLLKNQQKYFKSLPKYQQIFNKVCSEFFGDNIYHTLCELIYHVIFTFIFIWRRTFRKLLTHFQEVKSAHTKKVNNKLSQKVYMLYQDFFVYTFNKNVPNEMKIQQFSEVLE